nr:hypothetical protein 5 [bacterium]
MNDILKHIQPPGHDGESRPQSLGQALSDFTGAVRDRHFERKKSDFKEFCRQMAAKKRAEEAEREGQTSFAPEQPKAEPFWRDEKGREFCDLEGLRAQAQEDERTKAQERHGGDLGRRLDAGGFPADPSKRTFVQADDLRQYTMHGAAFIAWERGDARWLYLWGPEGTGKTSVAWRLCIEHLQADPAHKASFLSMASWEASLFGRPGDQQEVDRAVLDEVKRLGGGIVVLDDFDKGNFSNPWVATHRFALIDHLYRAGRRVVITANAALDELKDQAEAAPMVAPTIGRIREMCGQHGQREFLAESFRG